MITVRNIIDYIKKHETEFDLLDARTITNKILNFEIRLLQDSVFNWKFNSITISRFDNDNSLRKEKDPYIIITGDDKISDEETDELYFLFKSIKNRIIKEEIENKILNG